MPCAIKQRMGMQTHSFDVKSLESSAELLIKWNNFCFFFLSWKQRRSRSHFVRNKSYFSSSAPTENDNTFPNRICSQCSSSHEYQ